MLASCHIPERSRGRMDKLPISNQVVAPNRDRGEVKLRAINLHHDMLSVKPDLFLGIIVPQPYFELFSSTSRFLGLSLRF
jgi:hypothetical protein